MFTPGQKAHYATAHGIKPEGRHVEVGKRNPTHFGGIVAGDDGVGIGDVTAKKGIGRVYRVAGKGVDIRKGKQKFAGRDFGTCFLMYLTQQTVGDALAGIDKAAGQVERAFGGFAIAHHAEQLVAVVADNGHGGSRGIGIEREAAGRTTLAESVVLAKPRRAAVRAEFKVGQRMIHY